MSRYAFVEHAHSQVITSENARKQFGIHQQLKKEAIKFDQHLEKKRKTWVFIPPSAMAIRLHQDDLVLCVPQTVGRTLIRRKLCSIIERDHVAVDAVLEGEHEQVLAVFGIGLGAAEGTEVSA